MKSPEKWQPKSVTAAARIVGNPGPCSTIPEWVASIVISTRWLHPQQNLCPRQEGKKKGREGKACVSWVCRYLWGKQWISLKPPQQASGHLLLAGTGYKITTGCKGAWEGEHFIWDIVSQTRLGFCWWRRGESRSRVGSSVCLRTIFPVLWTRGFKTYSKPCTWSVKKPDSASKIPICVWAGVRCWALFLLHHDTNNGNTYGRSDWFVCLCIHLFTPGVCVWCVHAHMHMHSFLPEIWIEFVLHQCFYWGKKKVKWLNPTVCLVGGGTGNSARLLMSWRGMNTPPCWRHSPAPWKKF